MSHFIGLHANKVRHAQHGHCQQAPIRTPECWHGREYAYPSPCRAFSSTTTQMLSDWRRDTKSAPSLIMSGMVATPRSVTMPRMIVKYMSTRVRLRQRGEKGLKIVVCWAERTKLLPTNARMKVPMKICTQAPAHQQSQPGEGSLPKRPCRGSTQSTMTA